MNFSLEELYFQQLADIYDAENRLLDALPKLADRATDEELQNVLARQNEDTRAHIARLDGVFARHQRTPERHVCKAMQGLLEEASEALEEVGNPHVNDAHLIAQTQRIKHYEIAAYGTLKNFAKVLEFGDDVDELGRSLDEDALVDVKLSEVAMGGLFSKGVNQKGPVSPE